MTKTPFDKQAGFVAARKAAAENGWVVIYLAAKQDMDVGSQKYAVVCDKHATLMGTSSLKDARTLMRFPEFCEECMDVLDAPNLVGALVEALSLAHSSILQDDRALPETKAKVESALRKAVEAGHARKAICREDGCIVHGTGCGETCHVIVAVRKEGA